MNRIGLHITNGSRLPLVGPGGRPRIVKLHNCSVAYKRQVRTEVGPDCTIVVRWFEARQDLADPEREAEDWVARHYHDMRAMADGDSNVVFEGYNEIPDDMAPAFAPFERRRLQLMHAAGLRTGVGSWSVGTPDLHVWQVYRPVLEAMRPTDIVCLHEYWADGNDIGNHWLTARFAHPSVAPYLVGRQIAITECGRDRLQDADGTWRGARGWQLSCNAETFFDELRAYDRLIAQHPNVIGATVFDDGSPDPQWHPYSPAPVWGRVVAAYTHQVYIPIVNPPVPAPEPGPEPKEEPMTVPIDGRLMDAQAFRQHVETLDLDQVRRVVIHHTAKPDEATWIRWGGWHYWKGTLKAHYESKGWSRGPHLFVGPDGIGLFYDLEQDGRGVGGGSLEQGARHIEIVGNFSDHVPEGTTLANAVAAAAAILDAAGLGIDALTHHTAVVGPGVTECPGAALRAAWGWFVEEVAAARVPAAPDPDLDALWQRANTEMIPQYTGALFYRYARAKGWEPVSGEWDEGERRCQVWFDPVREEKHLVMHPLDGSVAATRWAEDRVEVDSREN